MAESLTAVGLGGLFSRLGELVGPGLVDAGVLVTVETLGCTHPGSSGPVQKETQIIYISSGWLATKQVNNFHTKDFEFSRIYL